uniref:Uncharacterized protein n=1 Tax=Arundo donax TaxID=35708 RepID=A0A0A9CU66_ARUDO
MAATTWRAAQGVVHRRVGGASPTRGGGAGSGSRRAGSVRAAVVRWGPRRRLMALLRCGSTTSSYLTTVRICATVSVLPRVSDGRNFCTIAIGRCILL